MKVFLPSDFMERVVAWPGPSGPGWVNLHWQSPDSRGQGFRGRPFKQLQDFMELAGRAALKPSVYKEVYFCLSTQATTGKLISGTPVAHRHRDQATFLKALWIDVDVKPEKGYPTLDEAMDAINKFVVDANLPPYSSIVYSGGGVHVYWFSDKPLPRDDWRRYAEGLRSEIGKHGLKCDAGLTTDAARVLRVPGTFNNKLSVPRAVRCAWLGDSYDFAGEPRIARLATIVQVSTYSKSSVTAAVTGGAPPFDMSKFAGKPMASAFLGVLDPADSLAAGINLHSDLPLDAKLVLKGCAHYREALRTGGRKHSQGLWMQTVLGSTFFENGRVIAHALGDQYLGSSPEIRDDMYDRKLKDRADSNLGWPGCKAFENEGAKCKQCPFYGRLRSPLNLAERVAPKPVFVAQSQTVDDLMLPPGFSLDSKGIICEIVTKTDSNGHQEDVHVPLFQCELRTPIAQAGRRALLLETSLDHGRWGPVTLIESNLASEQAMLKQLRDHGVKPCVPNQKRIMNFMTSWLAKLDAEKSRIMTAPFGWLREGEDGTGKKIGFAYGGKVFMADGTEQQAGYADQEIEKFYRPRGDISVWYQCHELITRQRRPALEVVQALSFAAPLMCMTGKHNAVMVGWSPESGAHKSTTELIGLGVWGCPRITKESPISSIKGIIHKLGQIKNLPVYWDEISDDEKMDRVRGLLNLSTEGAGATNLTQGRTFFEKDEWQTLMFVGANVSLVANILRNVKSTDAQLHRVFEFIVPQAPDTARESDVSIMVDSLDYNYGKVGLLYAKYLGNNPDSVATFVKSVQDRFIDEVGQRSVERFRTSMAACVYAGAKIANEILGCSFNLEEMWHFLIREFKSQREVIADADIVGGTHMNTLNAVTQFMKAHSRNALWVNTMPVRKAGKPEAIHWIAGPRAEHPDPVHVRLAVADRIIDISRRRFMDYLQNAGQDPDSTIDGLKQHFQAKVIAKVDLSAGAQVIGGREHIIRIPVPQNSPWESDLFAHATLAEREAMNLGQVDASPEVTAAVTKTPPVPETGIAAAKRQAEADNETVRKATGL